VVYPTAQYPISEARSTASRQNTK